MASRGRRASQCKFGTPNMSESKGARKLKLKTPLDIVTYSPWVQKKISARGVEGGTGPHNVNLGPPKISETILELEC